MKKEDEIFFVKLLRTYRDYSNKNRDFPANNREKPIISFVDALLEEKDKEIEQVNEFKTFKFINVTELQDAANLLLKDIKDKIVDRVENKLLVQQLEDTYRKMLLGNVIDKRNINIYCTITLYEIHKLIKLVITAEKNNVELDITGTQISDPKLGSEINNEVFKWDVGIAGGKQTEKVNYETFLENIVGNVIFKTL